MIPFKWFVETSFRIERVESKQYFSRTGVVLQIYIGQEKWAIRFVFLEILTRQQADSKTLSSEHAFKYAGSENHKLMSRKNRGKNFWRDQGRVEISKIMKIMIWGTFRGSFGRKIDVCAVLRAMFLRQMACRDG